MAGRRSRWPSRAIEFEERRTSPTWLITRRHVGRSSPPRRRTWWPAASRRTRRSPARRPGRRAVGAPTSTCTRRRRRSDATTSTSVGAHGASRPRRELGGPHRIGVVHAAEREVRSGRGQRPGVEPGLLAGAEEAHGHGHGIGHRPLAQHPNRIDGAVDHGGGDAPGGPPPSITRSTGPSAVGRGARRGRASADRGGWRSSSPADRPPGRGRAPARGPGTGSRRSTDRRRGRRSTPGPAGTTIVNAPGHHCAASDDRGRAARVAPRSTKPAAASATSTAIGDVAPAALQLEEPIGAAGHGRRDGQSVHGVGREQHDTAREEDVGDAAERVALSHRATAPRAPGVAPRASTPHVGPRRTAASRQLDDDGFVRRRDLDDQHPSRGQPRPGHADDRPDRVEAVIAAAQREPRLPHLDLERQVLVVGDVRGVGDHEVEAAPELRRQRVPPPSLRQPDPARRPHASAGGVGTAPRRGRRATRPWPTPWRAGSSRASASAMAPDPVPRSATTSSASTGDLVERPADDLLGLRARDEHPPIDHEVEVAEPPAAEDVLERLAGEPALDHLA